METATCSMGTAGLYAAGRWRWEPDVPSAGTACASRYTSSVPRPPVPSRRMGASWGLMGSTSTDLVLTGRDGTLIDYQYLPHSRGPGGRCAGPGRHP